MVKLKQATAEDVPRINEILNDPSVRPFIFVGDEPLDFSHNIGVTQTYLSEHGVLFAESVAPGEYLVLAGFQQAGRGAHAIFAHRQALDHFFPTTDATSVLAIFDSGNTKAIRVLSMLGFQFQGEYAGRGCVVLDWVQWALKSTATRKTGLSWAESYGIPWASEEELHVLGAFIQTVRAGWSGKAMAQFGKWAKLAAEDTIHPLNEQGTLFQYRGITFGVPEDCSEPLPPEIALVQKTSFGLSSLDGGFLSSMPGETFREKIVNIENALKTLPQEACELRHFFSPGIYVRELYIPKGTLVIGKIHAHEHPVMLTKGSAAYLTEFDGVKKLDGPCTMVSQPGTKRMLFTLEDCVWMTVHANPTDTQDIAELEDWIIVPNYQALAAREAAVLREAPWLG